MIYDDIDSIVSNIPFGEVTLSIKRHGSNSTQLIIHSYDSQKFKSNSDVAAAILQLIKDEQDSSTTGSLTFTITLKDGKAERLIKQGYKQVDYTKQ